MFEVHVVPSCPWPLCENNVCAWAQAPCWEVARLFLLRPDLSQHVPILAMSPDHLEETPRSQLPCKPETPAMCTSSLLGDAARGGRGLAGRFASRRVFGSDCRKGGPHIYTIRLWLLQH